MVWTDAAYARDSDPPGCLGAVVLDKESGRWYHSSLEISEGWLARFAHKEQYIGQLEILAAVSVYLSLPGLRGRDVIHFIDNSGSMAALCKGYSCDLDSVRLVHSFHALNESLRANVWFNYVPSGANISDLPSRGRTEECLRIIFDVFGADSEEFRSLLPEAGGWLGVYSALQPRPREARSR